MTHRALMLHGWLMSPAIWRPARAALGDRWEVIAPWQPSHGAAEPAPDDLTMPRWAAWALDQARASATDPVVLVGHSMGAMASLQAAIQSPERVAGLVLIGGIGRAWDAAGNAGWRALAALVSSAWSIDTAKAVAPYLVGPALAGHAAFLDRWQTDVAGYQLDRMNGVVDAIADRPDLGARLDEVRAPTLIVHGALDAGVPLDAARRLHAGIAGAQLAVAEDAGHCPPLERPEWFADILASFLALPSSP